MDALKDIRQMQIDITNAVQSVTFPTLYGGIRPRYIHVTNNTGGKIAFTVNSIAPTVAKVNKDWEENFVIDAGDEWSGTLSFGALPFKVIGQVTGLTALVDIGQY